MQSGKPGPWHHCQACIAVTQGCCVTPFESEWKIVVLPAEAEAIAALVGRDPASFIDETPLTPDQLEHYLDDETTDPLWATLFARWPRPTGFKGACPFLGASGCSLPYGRKPFLCQVYPLEFNLTAGSLALPAHEERSECDITATASTPSDVTSRFGDDLDALRQRLGIFRQRVTDLIEELSAKRTTRRRPAEETEPARGKQTAP